MIGVFAVVVEYMYSSVLCLSVFCHHDNKIDPETFSFTIFRSTCMHSLAYAMSLKLSMYK